jgi:hypothetical protein
MQLFIFDNIIILLLITPPENLQKQIANVLIINKMNRIDQSVFFLIFTRY